MNSIKSPIFLCLSLTTLLLIALATNFRLSQAANTVSLTYNIDRSDIPPLNDNELTLIINTANASEIEISDATNSPIPFKSGPAADEVTVTTTSSQLTVTLTNPVADEQMGAFRKAGLKDNYRWAYSHGFDDNYFLEQETAVFLDRGIPAGFNLVTRWIIDPASPWEGDFQASELNTLIAAGWAINNHATDHENSCHTIYDRVSRKADVLLAQEDLRTLIAASPKPDLLVLGYTVPCGGTAQFNDYPGIIREIRDGQEDTLLYTDGIFQFPFNVDVSPPYDLDAIIKRDSRIDGSGGSAAVLIAEFDKTSQLANESGNPHWYTTFSHGSHLFGSNVAALETMLDYLIDTYGSNGTNEVWIAPTTVVYSYLLVRDKSVVTLVNPPAETTTPSPTSTNIATATPTLISNQTPTPFATATNEPFPLHTSTPIGSNRTPILFLPLNLK